MSNPKMNMAPWRVRGLIVLLCMLFLVLATGTTEARYRAEKNAGLQFQVWEPAQIYIGTLAEEMEETTEPQTPTTETEAPTETTGEAAEGSSGKLVVDPAELLTWTEKEGVHSLEFVVANGTTEENYYPKDQQIRLRLVGSLGLGTQEVFPAVTLKIPSDEDPETFETFPGSVSAIGKGTQLYYTVGEGWIVRFQNEDGEEPTWILKGGSLNYQPFIVTVENMQTDSDVWLQPQAEADVILQ